MSQDVTVTIPENAMREEPLAFGLTLPQFAIAAGALVAAAVLFSFPIWLPLRIGIPLVLCGPVVVVAIVPARGEVLYFWVGRFVRFARAPKVWAAELALANSAASSSAIVPAPEPVPAEVTPAGLFREEYPEASTNGTAAADPLSAAVPAITQDPAPLTGPPPLPRRDHLVVVPPAQSAYPSQSPVTGTRVV